MGNAAPAFPVTRGQQSTTQSDVDRVKLFRLTLICFDGVVIYFLDSDFKFFDDTSEFSVTSFYVVFIFSSKFMLFLSVTSFVEM